MSEVYWPPCCEEKQRLRAINAGLVAALHHLCRYVEWHMPTHPDEKQHPTYSKPMDEARAAIAKAKGETR